MTHGSGGKVHGHAPRVRHRQSIEDEIYEIIIDKNTLLNKIALAAVGAIVGTLVTRAVFKNA